MILEASELQHQPCLADHGGAGLKPKLGLSGISDIRSMGYGYPSRPPETVWMPSFCHRLPRPDLPFNPAQF